MTAKAQVVGQHLRTVELAAVRLGCAWCATQRHEAHFPGSYLSVLCPDCRRRMHAYRQECYRRRLEGREPISLADWAAVRGEPAVPLGTDGHPVFLGQLSRTPARETVE